MNEPRTIAAHSDVTARGEPLCLIEIGSRGVRMLVAALEDGDLRPITRRYDSTVGLAEVLGMESRELAGRVKQIRTIVKAYVLEAVQQHGVSLGRTWVFGTEAVRMLRKRSPEVFELLHEGLHVHDTFALLARRPPPIVPFVVLGVKYEAYYALTTAVRSLPSLVRPGDSVLAIDQGSGSVELAVGRLEETGLTHSAYKAYPLGTRRLTAELRAVGGDCDRLYDWVMAHVDARPLRGSKPTTHTIVLGSAITMLGRIAARRRSGRRLADRYDPAEVHGLSLTMEDLARQIHDHHWGSELNQRDIAAGEFDTVLAGLVGLRALLVRHAKTEFVVCGEALRFGVAWDLASTLSSSKASSTR